MTKITFISEEEIERSLGDRIFYHPVSNKIISTNIDDTYFKLSKYKITSSSDGNDKIAKFTINIDDNTTDLIYFSNRIQESLDKFIANVINLRKGRKAYPAILIELIADNGIKFTNFNIIANYFLKILTQHNLGNNIIIAFKGSLNFTYIENEKFDIPVLICDKKKILDDNFFKNLDIVVTKSHYIAPKPLETTVSSTKKRSQGQGLDIDFSSTNGSLDLDFSGAEPKKKHEDKEALENEALNALIEMQQKPHSFVETHTQQQEKHKKPKTTQQPQTASKGSLGTFF